jgi:hypothetical protein
MKKSRVSDPIEPMTLGNMRENGVRLDAALAVEPPASTARHREGALCGRL